MKKYAISIVLLLFFSVASNKKLPIELYKNIFKNFARLEKIPISDPINDEPKNLSLLKVIDKRNILLGYVREISTSTGCNDGCLPVIFTLFYNAKGEFLRLLSVPGLTKKNHAPFKEENYIRLESLLLLNPKVFKSVKHPKEMVDAITSATKLNFKSYVIAKAAYTTLRVNLYNQQTLKFIQGLK